jgi:hypothetical protein
VALLEQRLRETESAALAALSSLPVDSVTRRNVAYLPPESDRFEIDVMCLPESASGQLTANADIEARMVLRVIGRNADGTLALDVVRWLCDVAVERLFASPELAALLAQANEASWSYEFDIANGAPVVTATMELRTHLRHEIAGGPAVGIAARVVADAGKLRALGLVATPVIYPAGLQLTMLAPATVSALFAGVSGAGGESIELRRVADGTVVSSAPIATPIGRHDFTSIAAGQYRLFIVSGGEDRAQTDVINVQEIPS